MAVDRAVTKAHVTTPAGRVIGIPEGSSLVFGRGPDADLVIAAGRGLSRRAGQISAIAGGALVANISATHALYAEGDGFRIRLPRLDAPGEPAGGWFAARGTTLVGSRSMLDEGQPLRLVVSATPGELDPGEDAPGGAAGGDATVLPLYLDPNTKLFLVALIWCRPWLIDPARSTPLPRTPEIARAVDWNVDYLPNTRHAKRAEIILKGAAGENRVELETLYNFYMHGIGYGHPKWGHGYWVGDDVSAYESFKLSDVNEADPMHQHIQSVCRAKFGSREGMGILEMMILGPHEKSGFKSTLDMHR